MTIAENDAEWQGSLLLSNKLATTCTTQIVYRPDETAKTNLVSLPLSTQSTVDFTLRIQRSGQTCAGVLTSDGLGFFPTNEWPTAIVFTESAFAANVNNVRLPADSTLLEVPILLTLELSAQNANGQINVSPTEIQGKATLAMHYEGLPHLNTTTSGRFLLMKPPVRPSTNQVKLVSERF